MNFTLTTDLGDLDLLREVAGLGDYTDLFASCEALELYGMRCKVLTLEGLIKSKQAVARAKDLRLLRSQQRAAAHVGIAMSPGVARDSHAR